MLNAQQWLESQEKYNTQQKRKEVKELDIFNKNLAGELDLSEFISLEWLGCSGNQLTKLVLSNCLNLRLISCSENKLTNLDLTNLKNLEVIYCYDNQLTKLILPSDSSQLTNLVCSNNQLTTLNWSELNSQQLKLLNIGSNNFSLTKLTIFSSLVNLEVLYIGNYWADKINQNIYNRFAGSLEPLQNLRKLRELDISNTDLNSGVEYLPSSLKRIWYSTNQRPNSKVREIKEQLDLFTSLKGEYQSWKQLGFTFLEIKSWLENGLEINEYQQAYEYQQIWKDKGFTNQQIYEWLAVGLKVDEYLLADYLQYLDYKPNSDLNLEQLRIQFKPDLKKHKKLTELGSSSDYAVLLQRWKQANFHLTIKQLQDQLNLLESEKERLTNRIADLETLTKESERLIKEQKTKVAQAYLYYFNETQFELVQKVIDAHLELIQAKKEKLPSLILERKCIETKLEVLNKLGEETAEKTQLILTDFEELYQREWDLIKQQKEQELAIEKQLKLDSLITKQKELIAYQQTKNCDSLKLIELRSEIRTLKNQLNLEFTETELTNLYLTENLQEIPAKGLNN